MDHGTDQDRGTTLEERDERGEEDLSGMVDLQLDDEGGRGGETTLTPSMGGVLNLTRQTPQTADKISDHDNPNILPIAAPETPAVAVSPVSDVEDNPPALEDAMQAIPTEMQAIPTGEEDDIPPTQRGPTQEGPLSARRECVYTCLYVGSK